MRQSWVFDLQIRYYSNWFFRCTCSAPSKITDLAAECTVNTVTLTWKAPSGDKTGYSVTCNPPDGSESEIDIDDGKTTKAVFEGLMTGKEYNFAVVTLNGDLNSEEAELKTTTSKWLFNDLAVWND